VASFTELAKLGPVTGRIEASDRPDWRSDPIGEGLARDDLRPKLTGSPAYVHDLALPGMLHARAVLPPARAAVLEEIDTTSAESLPGIVTVIHDDRLVMVVAEREEQAMRAVTRLQRDIAWQTPDHGVDAASVHDHLRAQDPDPYVASRATSAPAPEDISHRAVYSLPYQAHAAIAPSCAVAQQEDAVLRVHTHSQGVYPLQRALASLFDVEPTAVEAVHMDGPGCYGHNLADDAAAFAAIAARALPGRPVRFQFSVEDEFAWEPLGPAMAADLAASLTPDGRIAYWGHTTYTDVHSTRPSGSAARLMPAWLGSRRLALDWPGAHEGGGRNTVPLYDLPEIDAVGNHVQGPLRTSALRTLGAYFNTFAAESFIDELAEKAQRDPMAFRLDHLTDRRAKQVLEAAAEAIGWEPHVGPSGRGVGLAVSRYKTVKAYVAAAIEASIDTETAEISVLRMILACDAGTVINPDGLANQIEGGALQGLSRALYEEIRFDSSGTVTTRDWLSYPVIGFQGIPALEVIIIDAQGEPPIGAGEAAVGPPAAALANAIDDAIGVRLRELPLSAERVLDRLYSMEEAEAARVLLH
jgi:nicotinate dehydrogenase subunit B